MVGNTAVWMVIRSTFLTRTHTAPGNHGRLLSPLSPTVSCLPCSSPGPTSSLLLLIPSALPTVGLWNSQLHAFLLLMKVKVQFSRFSLGNLRWLSNLIPPILVSLFISLLYFLSCPGHYMALFYASVYMFIILLVYQKVSSMRSPICFICWSPHSIYNGAQHTVGAQKIDAE